MIWMIWIWTEGSFVEGAYPSFFSCRSRWRFTLDGIKTGVLGRKLSFGATGKNRVYHTIIHSLVTTDKNVLKRSA